jgi:hypothetical protein
MFLKHLPSVIVILIVRGIGIIIRGYLASKWFKWDQLKGIPVVLTTMFGFLMIIL